MRSAIADARKYRRLIEENRLKFQQYSALYAQDNNSTHRRVAAQALYDVAIGHELLGDHRTAIENYQRVIDEFAWYRSTWKKTVEIYYHKLFDYGGGSHVHTKNLEIDPGFDVLNRVFLLSLKTSIALSKIRGCRASIEFHSNKNAKKYVGQSSLLDFDKNFISNVKSVIRAYKTIAQSYEELRNYAGVISTYRELADRYGYEFDAVRAHHGIGMLYAIKGKVHQAVDAIQKLLDYSSESVHLADEVYQYAVANCKNRQFTEAYEYFKIYIDIGSSLKH